MYKLWEQGYTKKHRNEDEQPNEDNLDEMYLDLFALDLSTCISSDSSL